MFKKTIIAEFFTTVSFRQVLQSLYLMTFGSYKLRYGKDKELFEKEFLEYISGQTHGYAPTKNSRGEPCVHPEENTIKNYVHPKIISFYNGRSAIFHALKIIGIQKEGQTQGTATTKNSRGEPCVHTEVIVSAYNCVSVSNAVIQSGAKIIYSDIEKETLSFDFEILKKNINQNTKVIILQHTFGKIAHDYEKIIKFAQEKNILVIEDCAHSLGNNTGQTHRTAPTENCRGEPCVHPKYIGDFQIFSTGRDKVISSVTGGFLVINNKKYFKTPLLTREGLGVGLKIPSIKLVIQNLMYNIIGYKAYKLYDFFKLGRVVIFLSRKLNFITEILTPNEKACNFDNFNLAFPNSLAYLARKELKKLDEYTKIRLENIKYYTENIKNEKIQFIGQTQGTAPTKNSRGEPCVHPDNGFRFPILLKSEEDKNKLYNLARKNNIILGTTWSGTNLAPIGTDFNKAQYKIGSCPVAEDISKRILTLPNHKMIIKKDIDRVIKVLNNF